MTERAEVFGAVVVASWFCIGVILWGLEVFRV